MVHDVDDELRDIAVAVAGNPDDQSLHRALCAAVYQSVHGFLLPYARLLAPWCHAHDLEDVLQTALCNVFQKAIRLCRQNRIDTERGPGKLGAYFRTIAANELKDELTKLSSSNRSWPLPLLIDPSADGREAVAELPEEVRVTLATLEPIDRNVLEMRVGGKSYAEIGEQLGTSAAAAKMRYHRAVKFVRKLFAEAT